MSSRATAATIAAVIVFGAAFGVANLFGAWGDRADAMRDFRAFYCAGKAVQQRADPYRAEPLGTCERASPGAEISAPGFVLPAPFPGFTLGVFALLALAPFHVAACIWIFFLAVNFAYLVRTCTRLVTLPPLAVAVWLLPLGLLWPLKLGQLAPFAVSLGVAAALALRQERPSPAGIAAACTLIEPQIGIPICIAVTLCAPRARFATISTVCALATIGVFVTGWHANLEYARAVLPAHLRAELDYDDQFGTAYLLRRLGATFDVAAAIATAGYWFAAIGAAIVCRLEPVRRSPAAIALLPMGIAVAAGPFVHAEHLLAAVPLAMAAVALDTAGLRAVAYLSLFAIAWPPKWLLQTLGFLPPIQLDATAATGAPAALAQTAWQTIVAPQSGHLAFALAKVPTWLALWIVPVLFLVWMQRCRRESLAG